jgi:hypothetical protein
MYGILDKAGVLLSKTKVLTAAEAGRDPIKSSPFYGEVYRLVLWFES